MNPGQDAGNEARKETGPGEEGSRPDASPPAKKRPRRWLSISVFFFTVLLALIFHRCQEDALPPSSTFPKPPGAAGPSEPPEPVAPPETLAAPPEAIPPAAVIPKPKDNTAPRTLAPVDSGPYLWADPWGGRHFDSVRVTLHCRESCLILHSLEDSIHFKSYEGPMVFKRNATLWISGIDSLNRQAEPVRVDYVIERNPGDCAGNSMPIPSIAGSSEPGGKTSSEAAADPVGKSSGKTVCMDLYEWPDSNGAVPRAFVNHADAVDSCASVGKRLCTEAEWREACRGPDRETYPYGGKYHENHCPAKEASASRSGRFPVCRSYYGVYDMTGNVWEWTATATRDGDFFMVAGGNWTAGNEATCGYAKFSFYPNVRYPFVGFRCCQDVVSGR